MTGRTRKFGPRLTVSLTEDDLVALAALADQDEVSISWVVRRAIEEYLRTHSADMQGMAQESIFSRGN